MATTSAAPGLLAAALALCAAFTGVEAQSSSRAEYYTQNAICRQNNCVNPIFPGLSDLPRLEQIVWQCATQSMVSSFVEFCGDVVKYDPALPSPNSSQPVGDIVKQQDEAAATMYVYHLNGLGYDAGEHRDPAHSGDDCVKQIWRMVCFTYFPKAQAGCEHGQSTPYMRPCRNCCENYVSACQVECCDESVQCVFSHQVSEAGVATNLVQTGYVDDLGPSAVCTGTSGGQRLRFPLALLLSLFAAHAATGGASADSRAAADAAIQRRERHGADQAGPGRSLPYRGLLMAVVLTVCALGLQGCAAEVPHHSMGNWRAKADYLVAFEFIRPGQPANTAILNSCSKGVPETLQCSGRGYCKEWIPNSNSPNALSFCECDPAWADPECRTRRRSQLRTFLLSVFGGPFGLDYFYLGFPFWGMAKFATLGGCGLWWALDIVRSGSGQVYAADFRVAPDLPHWVYVLSTVTLFGAIGFLVSIESYLAYRKKKREDVMKLQESEETRQLGKMDDWLDGPRYRLGVPSKHFIDQREYSGYGATLPASLPNAGAPYAVPPPHGQAGRPAGPFGPARAMVPMAHGGHL